MKIEKAQKEDSAIFTDITYKGKAFWGYSVEQLEQWKNELTISPEYIEKHETYKLLIGEKIIGYYSFWKVDDKTIKLDDIFLLPEYIGKGYGRILMLDCIDKSKLLFVKRIILDAEPNAEGFYKRFGFETYNSLESSIKGRLLPQMALYI
ncbi:GNAT family N-acetyltransferase [Flavobacterium sp. RHBU_24]|uniref:GNAT family N-acetyltransferase n=1 Tax=Flavobacterium sp. RHBU_24 TaxID=3391185 RepID=UPI003985694E